MENIKEAIVQTLEDVNEIVLETAEDVKDFAVEKMKDFKEAVVETGEDIKDFAVEKMEDFKEAVIETEVSLVKSVETSVSLEVGEILELARSKLKKAKETKMEEMVEEVKPRLRRETFENSFMLNRVGRRQFLLLLLVIVQVMRNMLMLILILTIGLMLSVQTIVILLMLGLLFFLGGAPPASPRPVPVADPGFDWLRLVIIHHVIHLVILLDHQVAAGPVGGVHHPPPRLASCQLGGKALSWRQEVIF